MNNKKRVVFCESGYDMFYGAQQSLYNYLINLPQDKIDPVVLLPGNGKFLDEIKSVGIKTDVVSYPRHLNKTGDEIRKEGSLYKIMMPFSLLNYIYKYYKYFKQNKIDIVYCNDIRSILTCGVAAKLRKLPVLWYVRIDKDLGIFNQIGAIVATKVVLIANSLKSIFNERYTNKHKEKFLTVYTGLDVEEIDRVEVTDLRKSLGFKPSTKIIATIASIQPRKGQKDVVEAIKILNENDKQFFNDTKVVLVGDVLDNKNKQYYEDVKTLISKYGLEDTIYLIGWRKDIYNIMKQISVMVLPSYSEGLPRTILEAFACKSPVIATNVAGATEIVTQYKSGILYNPGDINALADAIKYMMKDDVRKTMGAEGRKKIELMFTMEKYVEQLTDLIINMTEKNN